MKHLAENKIEEMPVQGSHHWALEQMLDGQKVCRACWQEEEEGLNISSFLAIQNGMVYAYPNVYHYRKGIGFAGRTPAEFIKESSNYNPDDWMIYDEEDF